MTICSLESLNSARGWEGIIRIALHGAQPRESTMDQRGDSTMSIFFLNCSSKLILKILWIILDGMVALEHLWQDSLRFLQIDNQTAFIFNPSLLFTHQLIICCDFSYVRLIFDWNRLRGHVFYSYGQCHLTFILTPLLALLFSWLLYKCPELTRYQSSKSRKALTFESGLMTSSKSFVYRSNTFMTQLPVSMADAIAKMSIRSYQLHYCNHNTFARIKNTFITFSRLDTALSMINQPH